ncbi:hypothetical protein hmeg3_20185 [Herbaspirillum sp. meg3]|uniref:hypothetical protein n=1 Tax=Herbaspirillum sp. meg3 TaxID=2025949 RepID=UPI000B98CF05|nr:hypothetical protein [Herbaspirillum sp. meg3]ASU40383.1 hypothetical protein hmeg3_20185 [Herbaspirillum sp. meg3]
MDWLDATTAALAIIAVPLALRFPLRGKEQDDIPPCDCTVKETRVATKTANQFQTIPQEEEPSQERQPDRLPPSRFGSR